MRAEIRDTEAEIDQMTEVGRAENQPGAETEYTRRGWEVEIYLIFIIVLHKIMDVLRLWAILFTLIKLVEFNFTS